MGAHDGDQSRFDDFSKNFQFVHRSLKFYFEFYFGTFSGGVAAFNFWNS